MAAAIEVGIVQPVRDLTCVLSHGCTTGSCTFPSDGGASISSVGIGYACEDVTLEVRMTPSKDAITYWANLTSTEGHSNSPTGIRIGEGPYMMTTGTNG